MRPMGCDAGGGRLLAGLVAVVSGFAWGCATSRAAAEPEPVNLFAEDDDEEGSVPPGYVELLAYEEKTQALLEATEELEALQNDIDAQRRRLARICADHPSHIVCDVHSAAAFAREAFCGDEEFTRHVDAVVQACHQGACKQVDDAELLSRTQYMLLVQRLPHKLVLFNSAETRLDNNDRRELQQFMEAIRGEEGYIIIVGRASREGPWRDNLRYALDRAENTRRFIVDHLGVDERRVGYITYGHEKMYLTSLDAERLAQRRLSPRQANRSALVFTYPCFKL